MATIRNVRLILGSNNLSEYSGAGELYVVATPIGNLKDMSARAVAVLQGVDGILAEDTRHSRRLLREWNIDTPVRSYHEHSSAQSGERIVDKLLEGKRLALICDAGTPLISDPGIELVRAALGAGVRVIPVPGASAVLAALVGSGYGGGEFHFAGFLPAQASARKKRLLQLHHQNCVVVMYEAPHRLGKLLQDMLVVAPHRAVSVARELTKLYESFYWGTPAELIEQLQDNPDMARGELVLIWDAHAPPPASSEQGDELLRILLEEMTPAAAARVAARFLKVGKSTLYKRALSLQQAK